VQAIPLSPNASHKDATFHALLVAAELTRHILTTSLANSVTIFTADHQILPWCMSTGRHDNVTMCKAIHESLAAILFDHLDTSISLSWIPGTTGIPPLNCILEVATTAAASADLAVQDVPPTIAALREDAKCQALKEWEKLWLADPHWNLAYCALHHLPSGQPPDFMARIEMFTHPTFCTAICLLTEHAFTGEYNARHRPRAPDLHGCQCGQAPLQTVEHVITECPLFIRARERFLRPITLTLSTPIIFGMKAGGTALAKFIKVMQACVKPMWHPVEDHR
jgi:hypothetical protein